MHTLVYSKNGPSSSTLPRVHATSFVPIYKPYIPRLLWHAMHWKNEELWSGNICKSSSIPWAFLGIRQYFIEAPSDYEASSRLLNTRKSSQIPLWRKHVNWCKVPLVLWNKFVLQWITLIVTHICVVFALDVVMKINVKLLLREA